MKTVAELALELGVTPQAIYKRLNSASLKSSLKNQVKRESGKTVITQRGQAIIKSAILNQSLNSLNQTLNQIDELGLKLNAKSEQAEGFEYKFKVEKLVENQEDEKLIINALIQQLTEKDEQLKMKDKQLEVKDQQIEVKERQIQKLMEQSDQNSRLLENMQVLLKMEQEKTQLLLEGSRDGRVEGVNQAESRKSFWNFFK